MVPVIIGETISKVGGLVHTSSAPSEIAYMQRQEQAAAGGSVSALNDLVTKAGFAGGVGIAAAVAGKQAAKAAIADLMANGYVTGPSGDGESGLPPGVPNLVGRYVLTGKTGAVTPGNQPTYSTANQPSGVTKFIQDTLASLAAPATAQAGQAAGTAAAAKLQGTIVTVGIILGVAIIVGFVVLKRR